MGQRFRDGSRIALREGSNPSVDVSEASLVAFQKSRPELVVIRSQRLALAALRSLPPEIVRETTVETRISERYPEVRKLLGDKHFVDVTNIATGRLSSACDDGPCEHVLNDELAPIRVMPTLTRLDLTWSRLNDGGMYYLKPLKNLEILSINLEDVTADGLLHLRGMKNLKYFSCPMGSGRIDDAGVRQLAELQALETVWMDDESDVTDAALEAIGKLSHLKKLHLRSTRIEGPGLTHLAKLSELSELFLGRAVRDISALPQFPSLKFVDLSGTAIDDSSMAPLSECLGLENIGLEKTKVTDQGVARIAGLPHLRGLYLKETKVGDTGVADLRNCPQLQYLTLDGTPVGSAGLAELAKFPKLHTLSLYNVRFDEKGIQNLISLKQLKSLSVSYVHGSFASNQAESDAKNAMVERLRKALPNCLVY